LQTRYSFHNSGKRSPNTSVNAYRNWKKLVMENSSRERKNQLSPIGSIRRSRSQAGFTLAELLVVVAVIAVVASIVYGPLLDAIHKYENSNAANRLEAVANAKVRYNLDHVGTPDTFGFSFADLQPYLQQRDGPVASESDLMLYTGGRTINYGTPATPATVSPALDPRYLPQGGSPGATQTAQQ
jgi:prepilin-type N-terminal cleavage/methylation domain-containing protein